MNAANTPAADVVETHALQQMLLDARARTLAHAAALDGEQLLGPRLTIVNPPLWEIGHLGWFQEHWCLRQRPDGSLGPSMLPGADSLYDSSRVPHASRWDLPLPSLEKTLTYLARVLDQACERLTHCADESQIIYFAQLAALHEEMHCEAFTYTRQTLALPPLPSTQASETPGNGVYLGDADIAGGEFMLGAYPDTGFVFDNEKWAHPVTVGPFRMARTPVTNQEYEAFVDAGGYARRGLWTAEGWAWRVSAGAEHPVYWQKEPGGWSERQFDEVVRLSSTWPVMHVNQFEAEAYCRWARRRLPTEAEWEFAAACSPEGRKRRYPWGASEPDAQRANLYGAAGKRVTVAALPQGDSPWGCRQMIGNVWEWTADAFLPYPGFVADPYKEYSAPWFGNHKVLRGGCYATSAALIRNTWRNFYTPDRRDVFAGFRTCAQ